MIDTSKLVNKAVYLLEYTPSKFLEWQTFAWWREEMGVFLPYATNSHEKIIEPENVLYVYGPIDTENFPVVTENPDNPFKNL